MSGGKKTAHKLMDGVMDLLFPRKCPFCGAITGKDILCQNCEKSLPWCEKERSGANFQCVAAPLFYEDGVRKAVHNLKFNGRTGGIDCFGLLMARCAAEHYSGEFDAVTWAPVSRKRLKKRGYDQTRLLCAAMCRHWNTVPLETLKKTVDNPPQSGISDHAERRANVLGVYKAVNVSDFVGKRLLVIDDVCTSGSTLGECARVLKTAGAAEVLCLTLSMVRE